jgi:hypothetical protein
VPDMLGRTDAPILSPEVIHGLRDSFDCAAESFRRAFSGVTAPRQAEPENLMLAAIEARRNRNTGPGQRPRAPRQINPRWGR